MTSKLHLVDWVCGRLEEILGVDASEDITRYILAIESKTDLKEYLNELLDPSLEKHATFIKDLLEIWNQSECVTYHKHNRSPEILKSHRIQPVIDQANDKVKHVHKASEELMKSYPGNEKQSYGNSEVVQNKKTTAVEVGRNPHKFVSLFSPEGKDRSVVRLPGRHSCNCQGHQHGLINNCLKCGRVVCEQEGSGPCVFCGNLVCTETELEMIERGSRKGEKLKAFLMNGVRRQMEDDAAKKASEHKNKLISFDRSSAKTKVIDDESDYYALDNKWSNKEEREILQKKRDEHHKMKHASRKDRKITFDFSGRQLIEADGFAASEIPADCDEITKDFSLCQQGVTHPSLKVDAPQFVDVSSQEERKLPSFQRKIKESLRTRLRLQDRELQEVSDAGMCLSMHQPWASLLIKGIKVHEGRGWYSIHRGRLWIASTSQEPAIENIQRLESEASSLNTSGCPLVFPESYPVSCLLGCVDVVDVLPQEQYRQKLQYPKGESDSPYVFICENAKELQLKFPIKGQHKIYKLDSQLHKAAKRGLQTN